MIDFDSYIAAAETALVKLLEEWRPRLMESHGLSKFDLKADKSVVTELDGLLETDIKNALRPLSDEVGFVGEEHGQEGNNSTFWFVDPIDGTEQYIRGLPGCRTLLCFMNNGEPIYAFAYRFTTADLFTAAKGDGTKKNGKKIFVPFRPFDRCWIDMAAGLDTKEAAEICYQINSAAKGCMNTKEFLYAVEGFMDGYVVFPGSERHYWDFAPRALLLQEAGMKIANFGSDKYNYKITSLIATHPDNFDELQNLLSPEAS